MIVINDLFAAIFGNHIEDAFQLIVLTFLIYSSSFLTIFSIQNAKTEEMSEEESSHNHEHTLLALAILLCSSVLFVTYTSHIYINEVANIPCEDVKRIDEFITIIGKIFESFLYICIAWVVLHVKQEEMPNGKLHKLVYRSSKKPKNS